MFRPTPSAFLLLTALLSSGSHDGTASITNAFLSPVAPIHRSEYTTLSATTSTSTTTTDFPHWKKPTIDTSNEPPNLQTILSSLSSLKSGSDIRGTFVGHRSSGGTIANISRPIEKLKQENGGIAFTPFAGHCFGVAFAKWALSQQLEQQQQQQQPHGNNDNALTICIGRDPRPHGERLADAFSRGAESVDGVRVLYTDVASTPSMYEFVRADQCDAAVMITASHLPEEKNGMKFFSNAVGGLTSQHIDELIVLAQEEGREWYNMGILPPSSGNAGVMCSELVNFMPYYKETLKKAILREVPTSTSSSTIKPLANLNIVVNPGNGAGCFFADLLSDLGANVAGSIHCTPDGTFPDTFGVPNPEKKEMVEATVKACEAVGADIGVMFDTDADRSGFVLPRTIDPSTGARSDYEALNGNRMIALISKIFSKSSPGCTIVTDSTTSESLSEYLQDELGLNHYRHVRGYANVIGKAKELTDGKKANAEVAIEISGHCAMKENGYVDDGTYTAVKIIGLLARMNDAVGDGEHGSLLDLISKFEEMPYEKERRIQVIDGSLETTTSVFNQLVQSLKVMCGDGSVEDWSVDEDNREGVRLRLSSGGHFMIRKSLHDPVISMQVESVSRDEAQEKVLEPFLSLLKEHDSVLDYSALENA